MLWAVTATVLVLGLGATLAADAGTSAALDAGTSQGGGASQESLKRPTLLTRPPHLPPGLFVRGRVMVKCRVLVTGLLEECAVLTFDGNPPDPRLVEMFRGWATQARLKPAETPEGRPVEVPYVFNFDFR